MTQEISLTGRCPKCGEALSVPAHLKQFSCMYCGARLSASELVTETDPEPVSAVSGEDAAAYYREHILEVITEHTGLVRHLSKAGYPVAIDNYAAATRTIFDQLNLAWSAGALSLEDAAAEFLDQLAAKWEKDSSWKPGKSKDVLMDGDKFTIAVFLVPMVRRLQLPCCDDFCYELNRQWIARYPKSRWGVGDYDSINAGFKKKFLGLCFITTAVCLQSGKADDCAELTAFRNFRDGYLRACPDGPQLIEDYYDLAPSIVMAIDRTSDSEARYDAIRRTWLEPCFADIQAGRLGSCKERYTAMVRQLQKEYLS